MAHVIDKSALVMHSAERMFDVVNDIPRYPEFLPWCAGAEVHDVSGDQLTASLDVAKGGVRHRFTTRNELLVPERIDMVLVDGPFRDLRGQWHFRALSDSACKVVLQLEFEFSGKLARMAFGPVFSQAANTMVEAFCRRADQLHRPLVVAT